MPDLTPARPSTTHPLFPHHLTSHLLLSCTARPRHPHLSLTQHYAFTFLLFNQFFSMDSPKLPHPYSCSIPPLSNISSLTLLFDLSFTVSFFPLLLVFISVTSSTNAINSTAWFYLGSPDSLNAFLRDPPNFAPSLSQLLASLLTPSPLLLCKRSPSTVIRGKSRSHKQEFMLFPFLCRVKTPLTLQKRLANRSVQLQSSWYSSPPLSTLLHRRHPFV